MLFRMVPKLKGTEILQQTCFRVMLFRMVPKHGSEMSRLIYSFRVMLFRMVPKLPSNNCSSRTCFRVMLFRMVPKLLFHLYCILGSFRVMLFRMVPKPKVGTAGTGGCFRVMLLKNKLSPQAIRNFHHKIRIFIIKDELLQFSKTNQVISQNVDRLRLVLPFFRKGFFY